jgi:hypothetical protein
VIALNHCPDWIFDVVASSVAAEFLQSPLSLASVSQRFSQGMMVAYDEIDVGVLAAASENMVLILNEANTGEASVDVLHAFGFFRLNFEMDKTNRKISGIFGSGTKGEKFQNHDADKTRKRFKAYLFALRNGAVPRLPNEWKLENDATVPTLAFLVSRKTSVLDSI